MCGFSGYQALAYNEVHTSVCSLNRSEFNQDCSHEDEKIFQNNCRCKLILYENMIFYLVTLEGKLTEPGAKWICKIWKNIFNKTYSYGMCGTPAKDLGLITQKCLF